MAAYLQTSTHFNNWIFSPDDLRRVHRLRQLKAAHVLLLERQQQQAAAGGAAARVARKPRSFAALVPAATTAVLDATDWNDELLDGAALEAAEKQQLQQEEPPLPLLSSEQELVVRDFYAATLQESCSQLFRTSDKVKCCALLLFKRFYLSNSVMEFHPKFLVPTAIYVAGKVEEQYISVDTVAAQLKVDHKHVIAHEMVLLEGVRFQLIMYHPFRALLGFVDDFRGFAKAAGAELPVDTLQKLHANATVVVNELLLTDVPLTHYPAYLALAALAHVVEELGREPTTAAAAVSGVLTRATVLAYIRRSKFAQSTQLEHVETQLEQVRAAYDASRAAKRATNAEAHAKQLKGLYKALRQFHPEDDSKSSAAKDKERKSKKDEKKRKADKDEKRRAKKAKKEKK
ncbi:hypothetical protein PybrP1_004331 [[Pythium] brassicae (nom. inval.)]|nr:hypothetical protein PybrP1_004331 [[Pythium] brassicae (nom. inval.)]